MLNKTCKLKVLTVVGTRPEIIRLSRVIEKFDSFLELCKRVVKDLKDNKTVGWFQDKSEFGPRALGNRSLLVNPIIDNKDYLNKKVKYREYWRPYAPMVIEEEVQDWFTMPVDKSPHMLFNSWVVEDKKERIPSVVHEDGSARVQTVSEINNKKVYMLLQEFFKETGVPVLLNTSFNLFKFVNSIFLFYSII